MEFGSPDRKQKPLSQAQAQPPAPEESLSTELREVRVSLQPRTLPPPPPQGPQVADLQARGRVLVATGITRTFSPEELGQGVGFDACGQFHRLNQGELEFRGPDTEWEIVDPYAGPEDVSRVSDFNNIHELNEAITNYICQRVAVEGVSAMVQEPEPPGHHAPEPDYIALRVANEESLTALKTMPELRPVTKRSDWEKCEDGTLQALVFDALSLHDVVAVLGPMAEALARRINADMAQGLEVPTMDSRPLEAYQRLLADRASAAEKLSDWMSR